MKAWVTRGPSEMDLVDLPVPLPGPEEVLVRIAYCSVCGSDVTSFEGDPHRPPASAAGAAGDKVTRFTMSVPVGMILGHEVSGVVVEAGERVQGLAPGDRVALEPAIPCHRCWFCLRGQYHMCPQTVHLGHSAPGGFAEYLAIHELNAHRLPARMPLREGALLEPLGVCLAGLRRARLEMGETVAVFGDGPFGLIFARLAMAMGARAVWVIGHHDWRLERIRAPHVHTVNTHHADYLPALLEATEGRGADLAVVATPAPGVYAELLPAVRVQGRILAFSYPSDTVSFDMSRVQMREMEIIGSCRCPHTFETLFDLIRQGRLTPAELVTEILPLEQLPAAFARARGRSKELFKILIQLSEEP